MPHETFATLLNRKLVVTSQKTTYLAVEREFFISVMEPTVAAIYLDHAFYLEHAPDVAEAIARGEFASAADHFKRVGFYEHRMPYEISVDEAWYLKNYQDIQAAVRDGVFTSGQQHFYHSGYREGRFPYANFELRCR